MKTLTKISRVGLTVSLLAVFGASFGCSSASKSNDRAQFVAPLILNPRAEPQVAVLNQDFNTIRPVNFYADVKSFGSDLDKVKLRLSFAPGTEDRMRFLKRPVDIEMKQIGGTTWKATLSNREIQKLAISGETLKYNAVVVAKNNHGQISIGGEPVEITVQAPQHVEGTG